MSRAPRGPAGRSPAEGRVRGQRAAEAGAGERPDHRARPATVAGGEQAQHERSGRRWRRRCPTGTAESWRAWTPRSIRYRSARADGAAERDEQQRHVARSPDVPDDLDRVDDHQALGDELVQLRAGRPRILSSVSTMTTATGRSSDERQDPVWCGCATRRRSPRCRAARSRRPGPRLVGAVHDLGVERPVVPGVVLADVDGQPQRRARAVSSRLRPEVARPWPAGSASPTGRRAGRRQRYRPGRRARCVAASVPDEALRCRPA